MSAVCYICGETDHETWRFCSVMKEFVGANCEMRCENYSPQMLPNGTNCLLRYKKESIEQRLLNRLFIASPTKVRAKKEKFRQRDWQELFREYKERIHEYDDCNDENRRPIMCVDLRAMQEVLKEKKEHAK